mgnify:CR=1 FL=1
MNRKLLVAMGLATAFSFSGQATAAIIVDGVNIGSGGSPLFKVASIYEGVVTALGDILSGYGEVTQIFDSNGLTWSAGDNDTRLTYVFDDYAVSFLSPTHTDFTGGTVKFYTDHPSVAGYTALTPIGPGTAAAIAADFVEASTGNGVLWLDLTGNNLYDTSGGAFPNHVTGVSLHATGVGLDGIGALIAGSGTGLLDIVGGAAEPFFVKDTLGDADADGKGDAQVGSSFSNAFLPANQPLSGSADLRLQTVPEPSSIALLGIGLSAFGFFASRRRRA